MIPHPTQLIQLVVTVSTGTLGNESPPLGMITGNHVRLRPVTGDVHMKCPGKLTLSDVVIAVYAYNPFSVIWKLSAVSTCLDTSYKDLDLVSVFFLSATTITR